MKNNKILMALIAASTLFVGCEDNRRANMSPNMVYMAANGERDLTLFDVGEPETITVAVIKSGVDNVPASATVNVMPEELVKYNEMMATKFIPLPASCYTFAETTIDMTPEELSKTIDLVINVPELTKLGADLSNYALPIGVTKSSIAISEPVKLSVIKFTVKPAVVSFGSYGINVIPTNDDTHVKINMDVTVPFTNFWDLTCNITTDQAAFDEFNKTVGEMYEIVPSDAYKIDPIPFMLEKNVQSKKLSVVIDKSKLEQSNYAFVMKLESITAEKGVQPDPERDMYIGTMSTAKDLARTGWKIDSFSSDQFPTDGQGANSMLDGSNDTFWHSVWSGQSAPTVGDEQWFVVDMGKANKVTAIKLVPRSQSAGHLNAGFFETSMDKATWAKVGEFSIAGTHTMQSFAVKPSTARYFRVMINKNYGQIAEVAAQGASN